MTISPSFIPSVVALFPYQFEAFVVQLGPVPVELREEVFSAHSSLDGGTCLAISRMILLRGPSSR